MIPHRSGAVGLHRRKLPLLLVLYLLLCPASLTGQVVPDSLRRPPDTLPDSLAAVGDSALALEGQETPADSIMPEDTLPALKHPRLATPTPAGWEQGIWQWDREGILGSRALTLAELVSEVPGMVLLRGGDYGLPVSVSAFGAGGGRIRVFRDGIEMVPLEGSTPDLSRIGMAGLRSVRVVRGVGEVRIELERMLAESGRPLSLVEAGTGDLNTNVFRGTFVQPRAFGGSLALALDRVDSRGFQGSEPGSGSGGWIQFGRGIGSRGSVVLDFSRTSSSRGTVYSPPSASRTDWNLRSRWDLGRGLVGDLFYASSSLSTDSATSFEFGLETRSRYGALLGFGSEQIRAVARIQKNSGEGIAKSSAFLEAAGALGRFGGLGGEFEWEDWGEETVTRTRLRGWTAPVYGLSLFAERSSGSWGLPYLPEAPLSEADTLTGGEDPQPADSTGPALPGPRFSDVEGTRFGLRYSWRGLSLAAARVSATSDSLFVLGLPTDRSGETRSGGTRDGFELSGRLPLYPKGFALVGSYQWWDQLESVFSEPVDSLGSGGELPREPVPDEDMPWRYLPRQSYDASLTFHDTFFPTGNLELWFDLGVKGRDPMVVPFSEVAETTAGPVQVPSMVPFYQSWYVRLQIRVVSVRAFIMWENFTIRQGNRDFPDRNLPFSRSLYGVRWTMWN